MEKSSPIATPSRLFFENKNDSRMRLTGDVLADDFEEQMDKFYERGSPDRPLLIDLTETSYIEVAALVNCIALLVERTDSRLRTFIAIPSDRRVRDFLKVWRFARAVKDATGLSLVEFVVGEDRRYLSEPQESYTGQGDGIQKLEYDPDWEPKRDTPRNFFEFVTFAEEPGKKITPEGRFASAPRQEGRRWTRPLIQEVLEKHLPGRGTKDEVARVIIYEAMSNAVRHPQARVVQAVSRFERQGNGTEGHRGSLRICVWDDGDSIVKTLMQALEEGRSIQAFNLPPFMCDRVHVTIRDFDCKHKDQRIVDQSDKITKESATEKDILLASLFPGVTRTVAQSVPQVEPFENQPSEQDLASQLMDFMNSAPGMGLYALTRTVIDQFTGTLFIRSGRYRLIIEAAHDAWRVQYSVRYKCKITVYRKYMPPFRGNLLAIQLPLR